MVVRFITLISRFENGIYVLFFSWRAEAAVLKVFSGVEFLQVTDSPFLLPSETCKKKHKQPELINHTSGGLHVASVKALMCTYLFKEAHTSCSVAQGAAINSVLRQFLPSHCTEMVVKLVATIGELYSLSKVFFCKLEKCRNQ